MIQTYARIFSLFGSREKRRFVLLMMLALVNGVFEAVGVLSILPFLRIVSSPDVIHTTPVLSTIHDVLGFETDQSFIVFCGAGVFALILLSSAVKALTVYAVTRFSTMYVYTLSTKLLHGFLFQPYVWFLGRNSSDLGKTVLSEVGTVVSQQITPAMTLLTVIASVLCVSGVLFVLEPFVALGAIAVIGGSYLLIYLAVQAQLAEIGRSRLAANKDRFKITQEATGGFKEVKIMGLEPAMLRRFRGPARIMASAQAKSVVISQLPRYGLEALSFGGLILLILLLVGRGTGGIEEVLPVLGLVALAGARLFPAIQSIFRTAATLKSSAPAMEAILSELREIDSTENRTTVHKGPLPAPMGLRQRVELRDVEFAYPQTERSALNGLSLRIEANSVVGLVGGTGAGKTTVVDIILGLLRPQSGTLLVDDAPIDEGNRLAWQRSIGYVPQQIFLTDETVASNIAFGLPKGEIDMDAVERAARIAALHNFVMEELPRGYDTVVGERGVRLSGGQRQRIGIARALYHDPDVLILDEATSALDNITEEAVMDAVHNLGHAKTIIMIAHRLTTVENCDCIYLLERGTVAAVGTYSELVAGNETFRRMARAG